MNKDKKIEIQQKTIESLNIEKQKLQEEIENMKIELQFEKDKPKEGYERAKELIEQLENQTAEYKKLIEEAKSLKKEYESKINQIVKTNIDYKNETKNIINSIRKGIK